MVPGVYGLGELKCDHSLSRGYDMKAMHIHDVYEIYLTLTDGLRFFVNDRVYSLKHGDVMLFRNTDLHKVSVPPEADYERYVITFPPQPLQAITGEGARLLDCFETATGHGHKLTLSPEEQARFITLAEEIRISGAGDTLVRLGQWLSLCQILLLLNGTVRRLPDGLPAFERAAYPQIRVVMKYIDENFTCPIALDELSALCFLNKSYLCRLFRRETGFSIGDYIVYRRLSHAMALLREGESVASAARQSGFGSDSFFITSFRRNIGVTPYQYARAHRVGKQ